MEQWPYSEMKDEERRLLQECLAVFSDPKSDRTALNAASLRLEFLEKRLLPSNPANQEYLELRNGLLVCTVGMRPMPVILTTLMLQPEKLYLLHSVESRRIAESIRDDRFVQELGLHPSEDIKLLEISLTDAPHNYDALRKIVESNPGKKVVVDISGGVKVMGTSLATAAFWLRLPVIYQLGEEVQGIVRPFSEHLTRLVNPYLHFGSTDLRSIQELFHSGNYDAALTLALNLREDIGDVTTLGRLDILIEFMRIYRDWDAFRHSALEDGPERRLASRLRAVHGKTRRMGIRFADPASIEANLEFLTALEDSWQPNQRSQNDRYRLIDIFAAAQRRAAAGKFDDAIGRLYRCLEMSASIRLAADCSVLDSQRPDLQFFVRKYGSFDSLSAEFQKKATYPLVENRSLGLKDQMMLLELSGERSLREIAGIYRGMENKKLMEKRNRSILAHGTVSVTKEEFDLYERGTRDIVSRTVGTTEVFEKLLSQASHPIVGIEL